MARLGTYSGTTRMVRSGMLHSAISNAEWCHQDEPDTYIGGGKCLRWRQRREPRLRALLENN
jgi:hypothetical protein